LVKRIGLDGTADRKGSFLNDIAVDEARKVAWPAADPSQATGRVKRHDNQLHRARVLEDAMGRAARLPTKESRGKEAGW